ncbi:MAG: hypothetical protein H7Z10_00235, partial [Gemmatimonadaceae bacterium]|nr:hypothetical protein [Acetobacteraceae bacterium]
MPTDLVLNAYTRFSQDSPSIAALPGGGFVAVWDDGDQDVGRNGFDGFNGVYGRVFDGNGAPVTPEFRVAQDTYNQQFSGRVVALPDGSFVVAWDSNGVDRNNVDNDINVYVRRFTVGNGAVVPAGPQTQITPDRPAGNPNGFFDQYLNDLVALPDGGFRVVYTASNVRTDWSVYTQAFDARGQRVGGEGQMNSAVDTGLARAGVTRTPGYQLLPLGDGGFWATYWEQSGTFPLGDQVWLQRHDAAGAPVGGRLLVSAPGDRNDNTYPSITALDGGRFAIAWRDRDDNDLDNFDAYVRTFDAAGTALSAPVRINTDLVDSQQPGAVVALPGGYFLASYASFDRRASSADLFDARARLFSPAGQPLTGAFDVSEFVYEDLSSLVGQRLADGRIAFAWSGGGSIDEDVYGTVLGAADQPTVVLQGGAGDDVLATTPFLDLADGGPGRDTVALGVGL